MAEHMKEYAVAPIQYRRVAMRHVGPRDAIETDAENGCLLKSMNLGTADARFDVTRLTEASFSFSTPNRIDPRRLRSIRPTRAAPR
jgi:hypothetical protein